MPDTVLNQDASNALSRSQARHSALLTALFNSTLRVYQINNIKAPDINLTSFLEANSLSSGRSFDASTLPRIDEHVNANAPWIEFYQDPYEFNKSPDGSVKKQSELSRGGEHATSSQGRLDGETQLVHGLPPNKERTEWLADGSSGVGVSAQEVSATRDPNKAQVQGLEASVDKVDFGPNGSSRQEPSPRPSDGLILSSDDVGSMAPSEQIPTDARKTPLSSKEAYEDRLDHLDREKLYGKEHGILSNDNSQQNVSTLGDPTPGEGIGSSLGTERTRPRDDTSRPDGVPRSQIDLARAEAFSVAPTTPDEQLRLEEVRSIQLAPNPNATNDREVSGDKESHSMQPPSNSSSHFTRGNTEDGVASNMPHLADLKNQMSGSQSDVTQGAPNEPNGHLARTTPGLRDHMFHGMNGESSRDLTLSRRPPMRIDTGMPSMPGPTVISGNRPNTTSTATANTPSGSATPIKSAHAIASAQSPRERMITRVSSGALRHKSVSEILGETPKVTPIHSERGTFDRGGLGDSHRDDVGSVQTPKSASSFPSPDPATFKQRLSEIKEKERSKLSTVVFTGPRNSENAQTQRSDDSDPPAEDKDYFLTLFTQKAFQPQGAPLLSNLVKTAHKTLTTSDYYTDLNERQACQVLTKIHDLQSNQRWSLRQYERSAEPNRPVSHWDVLLGQMKWMRTDFREERKWKMAAARFTADACADWVDSSPEDRKSLQVNVRPTRTRAKSRSFSASTPDLVHSADDEASEATDDDSPPGERFPSKCSCSDIFITV
ncbi:hypothetical protein ABVK25_002324 [Lepraria finkii]|uniref:HSA domain-containing protein n=1 Tax=Lepraria finkii TaxID=1340010 RepID=A0ABR4BKA4_9LECA